MAVYIDGLFRAQARDSQARAVGRRTGHRWCHLIADTEEELHAFAAAIGMKRAWFQPTSFPHYDLTPARRAAAVGLGAVEVTRHELVAVMRRVRSCRNSSDV
jgi:hypothetical protein